MPKHCPILSVFKDEPAPCIERDCALWVDVLGRNVNTGEEGLKGGCSIAWLPSLMVEHGAVGRGQTAATESLRNEIVACAMRTKETLDTQVEVGKASVFVLNALKDAVGGIVEQVRAALQLSQMRRQIVEEVKAQLLEDKKNGALET